MLKKQKKNYLLKTSIVPWWPPWLRRSWLSWSCCWNSWSSCFFKRFCASCSWLSSLSFSSSSLCTCSLKNSISFDFSANISSSLDKSSLYYEGRDSWFRRGNGKADWEAINLILLLHLRNFVYPETFKIVTITLLSSFLSCSIKSACCWRLVFGVQIGLDLICSTALNNRSNWLHWLFDITPALCRAFNWFKASERSCLYVSHAPRDLKEDKKKNSFSLAPRLYRNTSHHARRGSDVKSNLVHK